MNLSAIQSATSMWSTYYTQTQASSQLAAQKAEPLSRQEAASPIPPVVKEQPVPQADTATTANALPREENLVQHAEAMSTAAAATAMGVSTNTNLPELYKFNNQYLYGTSSNTWAKIDTNTDGVWDRAELTAYADAYHKATGNTLDVDDLLNTYGDGNVIGYTGQNNAYNDDALGISGVRDEILRAEMGVSTGPSGKPGVNQTALNDFVDKYTYGYPGRLYANIDQNEDGVWTLDELRKYAGAWEKATGDKMDAEALFAKYDRDGSGFLTYTEMNEMYRDDALGLSRIKDLLDASKAGGNDANPGKEPAGPDRPARSGNRLYDTLMDMWGSKFTSSQLYSLTSTFTQGMQKAAMLDAFMLANNVISLGPARYGFYGNGYGYGSNVSQMAGNIAMLNMFV